MATKGALSLDKQRYIQQNPYNVSTGYTKGCLFVESKVCIIQSGGVLIVNNGPILVIDNHTLLKININENNQVELSIDLFDKKDRLVAKIVRNEWVAGNANLWDIRADHQKLKIQKKTGRIDLEINVQNSEIRIKANLWYKKHCIKLSSTGVEINGRVETRFKNLGFVNCRFEIDTFNKVVMIKPKTGESWNLISQNSLESLKTECINIWNEKYSNARNS